MARKFKRHNLTAVEAEELKQAIYAGETDTPVPDCSSCRYLANDWTCMHPETTETEVLRVQFEGTVCEYFVLIDSEIVALSDEAFAKTWNNNEDAVYDKLREIYLAKT